IGIGSHNSLDGHWWQQAGGVLSMGIDAGGVTKILIADNATANTNPYVHFEAGAVLDVSFMGIPDEIGTWTVMELEGGDIDDQGLVFADTVDTAPGAWTFKVDNTGPNGFLTVSWGIIPVVSGPVNYWDGSAGNDWDTSTINWLAADEVTATTYADTAQVFFDEFRSNDGTVNLTTSLSPFSITVDNAPFTFTGTGSITGATGITKTGSGNLALNNTGVSDFEGLVDLLGGSITLGDATAFGASSGNVALAAGTTLDLGGFSVTKASVTLAGGTINNGTITTDLVATDAGTISAVLAGASATLTKSGDGTLILSGANTYEGLTTIAGGTLQLSSATSLGASTGATILSGGTLDLNGQTITEEFDNIDGTIINSDTDNPAQITNDLSGPSFGNPTFGGAGDIIVGDVIKEGTNTRRITKEGTGTLTFGGDQINNRYGLTVTEGNVNLAATVDGALVVGRFSLVMNNAGGTVLLQNSNDQIHNNDDANGIMEINAGTLDFNGLNEDFGALSTTAGELAGIVTNSNLGTTSTLTLYGSHDGAVLPIDSTFPGTVSGNLNLTKRGVIASVQTLSGTLSYTGDTTVNMGTLSLGQLNTDNDLSTVSVAAGAFLDLAFVGTDVVDKLFIDGVQQAAGDYTSADPSGAFTGGGTLQVTTSPVVTTPFADWALANGLDGTVGFESGPYDDRDGDGSNLYEYFFWDSDPLTANVFGSELISSGSGALTFTHDRPQDITDVTVTYQWTTDLTAGWTNDGASDGTYTMVFVEGTTGPAANGSVTHESVEVTPTVTVGGTPSQVFVRVTVTQP
ncbi:MAG: autotransporter-associated beta strand repeat-containing protein, partial [Lentimonas sp.]